MVDWLTFAVTLLGLGGLLLQIRAATRGQARDHDRQRRQATLDAWNAAFEWRTEVWTLLPNDRDTEAIRSFCPDAEDTSHPNFELVVRYLNYLENIAVGVHHDVYDIAVLDALAGGRVRMAWHGYQTFIEGRRALLKAPTLWRDFQALAAELDAL